MIFWCDWWGCHSSQPIETFQQRKFWRSFRYRLCFYVWHCNRTWWRDIQMLNLISLCHRIIVFFNQSKKVFINGLKLFFQVQSLQQLSYFQKKNLRWFVYYLFLSHLGDIYWPVNWVFDEPFIFVICIFIMLICLLVKLDFQSFWCTLFVNF